VTGKRHHGPLLLSLGLGTLAFAAVAVLVSGPLSHVLATSASARAYDVERMVFLYSTLPRLVMALLCGTALAASGAILQQVLRNPLASPTTVGVDAGARLALGVTTIFAPTLFAIGRDAVAFGGSAISTLLVFTLVRRRGFSAISIILAGLVVSLYCGALSAILVLVKDRYLASLFIWGGGSLSQQSWQPSIALAWRLGLLALPLLLLLRPLSVLDLDDQSVRSLGLSVTKLRVLAIGVAVALSAFVTSAVGVIGFIGLVAPIIARLSGARRFGERLFWSSLIGGLLLLLTDASLQKLNGASSEFVPTGAVTAVLGSPLLLLLLPRLKTATRPPIDMPARSGFVIPLRRSVWLAASVFVVLITLAIFVGRGPLGVWQIAPPHQWSEIMTWRLPRIVATVSAGALLGVAGFILQRLTGNEMASPEVLGVSAGGMLAVAVSLFAIGTLGRASETISATAGGLVVLALILVLGRRSGFAPERVLLAGIALNALIDAVVGVLSASGDPRAVMLLAWMGGSTGSTTTMVDALRVGMAAVALIGIGLLTVRWLAILPLGGPQAKALGVPLARARFVLLLLAALMTAAATPLIGPLTFVGLMAPHIVLAIGIRKVLASLLSAAVAGAGVMAAADWLARTVAFPLQLPTGLVAALVGAPVLMALLSRRGASV
jgi:ABC-type Fe3+-siderophore transport system permease subunit